MNCLPQCRTIRRPRPTCRPASLSVNPSARARMIRARTTVRCAERRARARRSRAARSAGVSSMCRQLFGPICRPSIPIGAGCAAAPPGQQLPGPRIERIKEPPLWSALATVVCATGARRQSAIDPVGCPIRGSTKTLELHQRLHQQRPYAVACAPVCHQVSRAERQDMAGEVANLYPRQQKEIGSAAPRRRASPPGVDPPSRSTGRAP